MAKTGHRDHGGLSLLSQARVNARRTGDSPRCGVVKSTDHKPCQNPAGAGTDHPGSGNCFRHGGSMAPNSVVAAREDAAYEVARFRDDMAFYGAHVDIGFEEALLEELQRSVGVVRWIETKLRAWGTKVNDPVTGLPPLLEEHVGFRAITISETEHAAWLRQLLLERQHLAQTAKAGVASGIAKKMIEVTQTRADQLFQILALSLKMLGVDQDDRLPHVLPAAIAEVTGRRSA